MERRTFAQKDSRPGKEGPEGIFRTTLSYNKDVMLCHFFMRKGAKVPLHNHPASQNGYVIRGKLLFNRGESEKFTAITGSSYVFDGGEKHGAEVLEEAEVIECFAPARPDYAD